MRSQLIPEFDLFAKGIILVAFPLLCQLIFFIVLARMLIDIQNQIDSENHAQVIIRNAHVLFNSLLNDFSDFFLLKDRFESSKEDKRAGLERITERVRKFNYSLSSMPEHKQDSRTLAGSGLELRQICLEGLDAMYRPDWSKNNREYIRRFVQVTPHCASALSRIVATEEEKSRRDARATEKLTADLVSVIEFACVLSVIAALLLGLFYARSIKRPLEHIKANALYLSERKPLLPVLKGDADFSALDSLLHSAASFMEAALSREKELIDYAADIIASFDSSGNMVSVNPRIKRILGYSPDEIIGKPLHLLAAPEHSFQADEYFRLTVSSQQAQFYELRLCTASGDIIETRWSCLWSQPHKRVFAVIRDVTEQKRVEQMKEDFSNMISHDLRSPLMSMSNSLTLIAEGAKGNITETVATDVKRALGNIERLIELVNDLLDFQKLKAGKMELYKEQVDLKEAAREAAELLENFAEEKNVKIHVPANSLSVIADRQKIVQALVNLLSNAVKFSTSGDSVRIELQSLQGDGKAHDISSLRWVGIKVIDNGPGIPQELREQIFEPFEQAPGEHSRKGTGLGLSICKLIAEAHGGYIKVEPAHDTNTERPASGANTGGNPTSGGNSGSVFTIGIPG